MSKYYVSEEKLEEIFMTQFAHNISDDFEEWVDAKKDSGEIELIEFNHYEVSKLDYKPIARLVGASGNIFNLMSIAGNVLIGVGKEEKAIEMYKEIETCAKSYDDALCIIMHYVGIE